VHLRVADTLADFGLGEVLAKRRCTTSASRSGSMARQAIERDGDFGAAKPGSLSPSRSASVAASSPSAVNGRSKESLPRARAASPASRMSSIVQPSRRASSPAVGLRPRSLVSCSRLRSMRTAALERRAAVDRPGEVAEVAPDLALDGGHGERAKGGAVVGVKAVQGFDQTERRDLLQIPALTPTWPASVGGLPDVLSA
jgi:hypothetical protein